MVCIKKINDNKFILHVYVKPNSKIQEISNDEDLLLIKLKSKPKDFKANKELLNLLKHKLNLKYDQIKIISGLKSQKKSLQLTFAENVDNKQILKRIVG